MTQTIIGVFYTTEEAQTAMQQLQENGFPSSDLILYDHKSSGVGLMEQLTDFFRFLFQSDNEARTYMAWVDHKPVVSVYTQLVKETVQAKNILKTCGACQLTEHLTESRTHTINTGTMNIGRASSATSQLSTGIVDDSVMQYGDRAKAGKLNTGTFIKPGHHESDRAATNYSKSV